MTSFKKLGTTKLEFYNLCEEPLQMKTNIDASKKKSKKITMKPILWAEGKLYQMYYRIAGKNEHWEG